MSNFAAQENSGLFATMEIRVDDRSRIEHGLQYDFPDMRHIAEIYKQGSGSNATPRPRQYNCRMLNGTSNTRQV